MHTDLFTDVACVSTPVIVLITYVICKLGQS